MSEIDQQFIEYVVKSLVGKPDAVHIERTIDEKGVLLELTVDPEDLGRVIGKRGATAQSLRTLLRALGTKNDARYNLKIIDNGTEGHGQTQKTSPSNDDTDTAAPASPAPTDTETEAQSEPEEPEEDTAVETKSEEEQATEAPTEPPSAAEPEKPADDETGASDRLAQTRKELADLDDLDV